MGINCVYLLKCVNQIGRKGTKLKHMVLTISGVKSEYRGYFFDKKRSKVNS